MAEADGLDLPQISPERPSGYSSVLGDEEGGPQLADRFFLELERLVKGITTNPEKFHEVTNELRRANMLNFPCHILFSIHEKELESWFCGITDGAQATE